MKHRLTKTAYLNYLVCPNEFWLDHHEPESNGGELSLEEEHLRQQGYAVERYVKLLERFQPNDDRLVEFQRVFQTADLYARSDVVITNKATGVIDIFEIKASSKVKDEHYDDVAFQKMVAEDNGFTVGSCSVITLNGDYVRNGDIDPEQLFVINPVDEKVAAMMETTREQAANAIKFLETEPVPSLKDICAESKLDCRFVRRHFPDLPDYSIFNISRINKTKLSDLLERGIIDILDVPEDFKLSEKQRIHVDVAQSGLPYIDRGRIADRLAQWAYPHHFLDYETFSYAIPQFDGVKPFQQMCFQYSLHTIREPGAAVEHNYFLAKFETDPPRALAASLREHMAGDLGTVFVWYEGFEKARNDEMAVMFPEYGDFFADVNAHTQDLMKIFSDNLYVHAGFKGSSSIKKVLPIIKPELSYKSLDIGDGMTASISWYRAAKWDTLAGVEKEKIFNDLEKYCELDTFAMVEIYRELALAIE